MLFTLGKPCIAIDRSALAEKMFNRRLGGIIAVKEYLKERNCILYSDAPFVIGHTPSANDVGSCTIEGKTFRIIHNNEIALNLSNALTETGFVVPKFIRENRNVKPASGCNPHEKCYKIRKVRSWTIRHKQ